VVARPLIVGRIDANRFQRSARLVRLASSGLAQQRLGVPRARPNLVEIPTKLREVALSFDGGLAHRLLSDPPQLLDLMDAAADAVLDVVDDLTPQGLEVSAVCVADVMDGTLHFFVDGALEAIAQRTRRSAALD
jgi:hypothetical protein